ncbi:MAG: hypothetical protein IPO28_15005 [Holophagaceae bacterium]|nr:hypothetical protein [Holophagaceae bacterium]
MDGVLTADPSLVKEARPIPQMSLGEAEALSAFGAKVLHADSLAPGGRAGFRLVVANTRAPAPPGPRSCQCHRSVRSALSPPWLKAKGISLLRSWPRRD